MNRHVKVIRNILALLLNQVGTWTITLLITLMVPPYLGVKLYGAYAFLVTYTGLFSILMGLGTGTYLTWRIARDPEEASRLTVNTLALQVPLSVLCAVVCLLILPVIDRDPLLLRLGALMIISTILSVLFATCTAALGGLQNMRVPAGLTLATLTLGAAGTIGCVVLHQSIFLIVLTGLTSQVLGTLAIVAYTHHIIHLRPRIELRLWPLIVRSGLPFFAWSAVLLFYWQIDVPMLKVLAGDSAVAWYSIANRIISIPVFVPTILVTAILPALSKEKSADSPHFRDLASRSIRLVSAVNIPACIGTMLLASSLLPLLHYPTTFYQAIPSIVILAVNIPLVALDMVLGTVLIALGKQKAWTLVGVVAAVVNPIANLWVIPATQRLYGNGAIGASLTTVLSEIIMLTGALYLRPRSIFTRWDLFYIARCLVAAAIMLPAVWALARVPGIGVFPAVAYGMVIYAFAAYTLQIVRNEDLAVLLGVVLGRLGVGSISDLWTQVRARGSSYARGGRSIRRLAARAGAVASRPLALAGARFASASPTAPAPYRPASPVRFGPPGDGTSLPEPVPHDVAPDYAYLDGNAVPVGTVSSRYERYQGREQLAEQYEFEALDRLVRRLPPAPAARRLRRAVAGVDATSRLPARALSPKRPAVHPRMGARPISGR